MPVYGYIRVSHIDSAESGNSPESQRTRLLERVELERKKSTEPDLWQWGTVGWEGLRATGNDTTDGIFVDRAVSAFRKRLQARPAGGRLDHVLKSGDKILVNNMNRAFRNARDFHVVTDTWTKRGVHVIFLYPDIDLQTSYGRLIAGVLASVNQWDSEMKSESQRELAVWLKVNGFKGGGQHPPMGWLRDPKDVERRRLDPNSRRPITLIPDNDFRRMAKRWAHLMYEEGLSSTLVKDLILAEFVADPNKKPPASATGEFNATWIVKVAKAYFDGKIPPPTDEPLPAEYAAFMNETTGELDVSRLDDAVAHIEHKAATGKLLPPIAGAAFGYAYQPGTEKQQAERSRKRKGWKRKAYTLSPEAAARAVKRKRANLRAMGFVLSRMPNPPTIS